MESNKIIIESDVVESIFRPISMFLNDIKAGTKLTLLSSESRTRANSDKLVHFYKYLASTGEIYSFTQFDIQHFLVNGVRLRDTFKVQHDQDAYLAKEFVVLSSSPRLSKDGNKMYPDFMFSGYKDFLLHVKAESANVKALREILYTTPVMDEYKDRYYRVLDADRAIIHYQ